MKVIKTVVKRSRSTKKNDYADILERMMRTQMQNELNRKKMEAQRMQSEMRIQESMLRLERNMRIKKYGQNICGIDDNKTS